MNRKTVIFIIVLSFFAFITPFFFYFLFFNGPISDEDSNWANFGTFIGGILSSVFSFASFIILVYTLLQNRETERKDMYIKYLRLVNIFTIKINDLLSTIVNIDKYSKHLLGQNAKHFSLESLDDYCIVINNFAGLQKYLNANQATYNIPNTNKQIFFNIIMKGIEKIVNPNIFIEICSEFENKACNYYYLIKQPFRIIYKNIIKSVQSASLNSMVGFDLQKLKIDLNEYIYQINEEILGKRLDRNKDIFDN